METFGTVITDLLDYVNRPRVELGPAAARAINNTVTVMQRRHMFKMSERLINITYPANSLTIDLADFGQGSLRDLLSIQLKRPDAQGIVGVPVVIKNYSELIAAADKYNRTNRADEFKEEAFNEPYQLSTHIQRNRACEAFIVGNQIGLYPTPTVDTQLNVNFHCWLPKLVDDSETNFLLEYCTDYVFTRALQTLQMSIKVDKRYQITAAESADLWETISQWDSQIRNSPGSTL